MLDEKSGKINARGNVNKNLYSGIQRVKSYIKDANGRNVFENTEEETEVLLTMGEWLETNGEGIYGTTFFKQFGEGTVNAEEGFFKDYNEKAFTSRIYFK